MMSYEEATRRTWRHTEGGLSDSSSLLRELVRYATLAPSSHNTQCWKFLIEEPSQREVMMSEKRRTTIEEARRVGDLIGVDWQTYDVEQFRLGMDVEFEHGRHDPQTDVTHDDPVLTGKIALAHMKEFPDYYERLERMEAEAKGE
jgi:hypothetical protein